MINEAYSSLGPIVVTVWEPQRMEVLGGSMLRAHENVPLHTVQRMKQGDMDKKNRSQKNCACPCSTGAHCCPTVAVQDFQDLKGHECRYQRPTRLDLGLWVWRSTVGIGPRR
jgi:hypothetical protein